MISVMPQIKPFHLGKWVLLPQYKCLLNFNLQLQSSISIYFSNLVCNFGGSCEYLVASLYNFISGWEEPIVSESRSPSAPTTWLSQTTRPAEHIQRRGQSEHCGQTWLDATDQSQPKSDRATKNLSTKEPKCLLAWEPAHSWHRMGHHWPRGLG